MFPPNKKPDMAMLGIAKRAPREQAPPPFAGPPAPAEETMEAEGMCGLTCPKCGEYLSLQVAPVAEAEPEEVTEAPEMAAAPAA